MKKCRYEKDVIVNNYALSNSDIRFLEKLIKRKYYPNNNSFVNRIFINKKLLNSIFTKMKIASYEELIRVCILSGLIPDNLNPKYKKELFYIAEKNITKNLSIDRILSNLFLQAPNSIKELIKDLYSSFGINDFDNIKCLINKLIEQPSFLEYYKQFYNSLDLKNTEKRKHFYSYIYYTYNDEDSLFIFNIMKKSIPINLDYVPYIFLSLQYFCYIFPYFFVREFSHDEIKILKYLCSKGDIYKAIEKFKCVDFTQKFLQNACEDDFTAALRKFMIFVKDYSGNSLDLLEMYQRIECYSLFDTITFDKNINFLELCKDNNNRLIIENSILYSFEDISLDHEIRCYINIVKNFKNCFHSDFIDILTGKKVLSAKERFERFYNTKKAINNIKGSLELS